MIVDEENIKSTSEPEIQAAQETDEFLLLGNIVAEEDESTDQELSPKQRTDLVPVSTCENELSEWGSRLNQLLIPVTTCESELDRIAPDREARRRRASKNLEDYECVSANTMTVPEWIDAENEVSPSESTVESETSMGNNYTRPATTVGGSGQSMSV